MLFQLYRIEDSMGNGFYGYPNNFDSLSDRLGFDSGHYENQPAPLFDGLGECYGDTSIRYAFKDLSQLFNWLGDLPLADLYAEGGQVWVVTVTQVKHGGKQSAYSVEHVIDKRLLTKEEMMGVV